MLITTDHYPGVQVELGELLTVVLQDNFSLKEENGNLRDRMLEMERDLAEMRRLDATRRETLDTRLQELESQVRQQHTPVKRTQPAPPKESSKRNGCLSQIFGP